MSAAMLSTGDVSGLTATRLELTPTVLVLISPMKVSTDGAGKKQLHSISCSLFNHNVPQMDVLCSIVNNFLENPYNLPDLPSRSIENDKLFGGLARKSVAGGVGNGVELKPTGSMCLPESDGLTSLHILVEPPQRADLVGVLRQAVTNLSSCNLLDPSCYDKIAACFDINTTGEHFLLAKSSNYLPEAIYNLLIAKHLVDPSSADDECSIKDLVWLPVEGMHRWLSLLSLICASKYNESGIVELNSLSDEYLRKGLRIKDDALRVNIEDVLKDKLASTELLFGEPLTVQAYYAVGTRESSLSSALSVLASLKKQSLVISNDKISSSTKSPFLSLAEGLSFLSGMKLEGDVQSSAQYSTIAGQFNRGQYSSIVSDEVYKSYLSNPSLGEETTIAGAVTRVTLFDTALSSFSDNFFGSTHAVHAPCPPGVNGLTTLPFLVKFISMAVFEKKGEPGWVDIQNIMVPVSLALVTFHNNILQQEKIMLRVTDQEKGIIFPDGCVNIRFTDIIGCNERFATVMRVVSLLGDMANAALSGRNDLQDLASLLHAAHISSGFSPLRIVPVLDILFLSIHNITDQLVSSLRKTNTFPPRFKLYWIVYFGVLQNFMSGLIKHGLFPEANTESEAATELARALQCLKQKKTYLSKLKSGLMFQGRKYTRLFTHCPSDVVALVSVLYCVAMSKQLEAKSLQGEVPGMFANEYFGGKKNQSYILVMKEESNPEPVKAISDLLLKDGYQFQGFLDHFVNQSGEGDTQSSSTSSSLLVSVISVAAEDDEDNTLTPSKVSSKSGRKRKLCEEGESVSNRMNSSGPNNEDVTTITSASLDTLFASVSALNDLVVDRSVHSDSDGDRDGDELVNAAQDVIKAVELLVPSGGNSFSEWLGLNESDD